ncbi:HAD family hydrolase [Blastochloris viridis]|uniref:Putative hydrolase (HAD superfamily) n=1 Tax=Blastochloris viridis TaxID=1079 RepID=A0A0H5BDC5_BLAVI|nr:hypothetical protein [Blastochloris viridis]ALK10916.1 hypothetical protein BVIR_3158 [Blastochloris viridis]BAR99104.1 hypothetical protein BV133_1511 [Blastochloris viridis]CUU43578.1 putative hydrolase (HAD superfamily) [Blastochloris viridis]
MRDETARGPARDAGSSGEAVSFDVFDTFVLRRCTTPDGVFERACRLAGVDVSRPGVVEAFVQHRRLAESNARKKDLAGGHGGEVTIEQIYHRFPRRLFGLGGVSVEDLAEAEFRAELDLCFADTDIARLYDQARAAGRRTGFVSDTYWSGERLGRLLRHVRPGLMWDFLYTSCDHATAKSARLFEVIVAKERLAPSRLTHIGDNPVADIAAPRRLGIDTRFHPQASNYFAGVLQREETTVSLLATAAMTGSRLDGGLRTLRRVVARDLTHPTDGTALGVTVVGPVMAAFDRFVADRVAKLEREPGRKVAVAFVARDGYLPCRLWSELRQRPAGYIEVNRRSAILAGVDGDGGFEPLFEPVDDIDHATTVEILGVDSPALKTFFRKAPGGIVPGQVLGTNLPALLGRPAVEQLAGAMRRGLTQHLRRAIPDYDTCTDLVLVDLGYSASVQKGIRRALTLAGPGPRLHGLYLLTRDEEVDDLGADHAEALISDLVVSPHVKRMLLSNVAVLEQLCCAQAGSVRSYRDGEAVREPDHRDPAQVELSNAVQTGALHFVRQLKQRLETGFDPFTDQAALAAAAVAMLGRLLLLPTDDELLLLGTAGHDVNLGSRTVVRLADPAHAASVTLAKSVSEACRMSAPPVWPAGSFTALSPSQGFIYTLFGVGSLPTDVFADVPCGKVEVTLIGRQRTVPTETPCLRTGHGDIRIHIPFTAELGLQRVAVTVGRLATQGLLRGVTMQQGASVRDAMESFDVMRLCDERLSGAELELVSGYFQATANGKLTILLPQLSQRVGVITVLVTPLGGNRVLALAEDAASAPLAPLALGLPAAAADPAPPLALRPG